MATPGVPDLSNGTSSVMMTAPFLQRVWTDDFPAVALEEFVAFVVVCRAVLRERLDIAAGGGRGVEKQHAAGFAAGVLPGMRDVARHERASAGPADGADRRARFRGPRRHQGHLCRRGIPISLERYPLRGVSPDRRGTHGRTCTGAVDRRGGP